MIRALTSAGDRLLNRLVPSVTAAGCCPLDPHCEGHTKYCNDCACHQIKCGTC